MTTLTLRGIATLSGQRAKQRTGIILLAIDAMLMAASLCLAFAFLDAAWLNPWTTLPLVVVAALIIVAFRGYARLRIRFLSLQHLYDFSQTMSTANLEPSSMSVDVLKEVCTVMRARRAELILAEPSGIPRRISFDDRGASGIRADHPRRALDRDPSHHLGRGLAPQLRAPEEPSSRSIPSPASTATPWWRP